MIVGTCNNYLQHCFLFYSLDAIIIDFTHGDTRLGDWGATRYKDQDEKTGEGSDDTLISQLFQLSFISKQLPCMLLIHQTLTERMPSTNSMSKISTLLWGHAVIILPATHLPAPHQNVTMTMTNSWKRYHPIEGPTHSGRMGVLSLSCLVLQGYWP